MNHVMLDIETLGNGRDAAIKSIGALLFDPKTGQVQDPAEGFHRLINLDRSLSPGVLDVSTVEWWLGQSQDAREALFGQPASEYIPLQIALTEFEAWVIYSGADQLWSNGPTFDERIMREAFDRHGMKFPLSFRGSRCVRTPMEMFEASGRSAKLLRDAVWARMPTGQVRHKAISDCWAQATMVSDVYKSLGIRQVNDHAAV